MWFWIGFLRRELVGGNRERCEGETRECEIRFTEASPRRFSMFFIRWEK